MRIRTDSPAYPALCRGCEACGAFPFVIAADLVFHQWAGAFGYRELVSSTPFATCEEHQRAPNVETIHRRGHPSTSI